MKKFPFLYTQVTRITKEELLNGIQQSIQTGQSRTVLFANSHMMVEGYLNPSFKQIIDQADYVLCDGVPVQKSFSFLNGVFQERLAGMDLFPTFLEMANKQRYKIFFFGNTKEVLDILVNKVRHLYPNIAEIGSYSPPFGVWSESEHTQIRSQIKLNAPDLLFVSLGCPKQEIWISEHKHEFNTIFLAIGNAFNTFIGDEKRPPVFFRNIGLEWLFRFFQNPKRLFFRYIKTNTLFIYLFFKHWLKPDA